MPNIGSPAIYTSISNKNFTVSRPTNPNDSKYVSPALDYKNIQPNEKIVRETTWNNTLSQGMVAPNGDYKVSVIFRKDVKQKEMVRYIDLISGKVTQAR